MKIGDVVIHTDDGAVGIIIDIDPDRRYQLHYVKWGDGCEGWHMLDDMEALCK